MSTEIREAGIGIVPLPNAPGAISTDADKSAVRHIWNPLNDINLFGPEGLIFRLGKGRSYYGQGTAGSGSAAYGHNIQTGQTHPFSPDNVPGETFEDYLKRGGDKLLRCQVYPLWNIQYDETLINLGKFTEADKARGNAPNEKLDKEEVNVYAGVCAADMVSQYGETHGMRILTPLIGMDGAEQATVTELINLAQPYGHKLTNLAQEESGGLVDEQTLLFDLADDGPAFWRIKGAKLDAVLSGKAEALRKVMLAGTRRAAQTARTDYFELRKQLDNAALGKVGFKSQPGLYDAHVCFLLGEPVPSAVSRPTGMGGGTDPELSKAVQLLTQHVVAGGGAVVDNSEQLAEMKSVLSQMRGERTRLEKLKKELAGEQPAE